MTEMYESEHGEEETNGTNMNMVTPAQKTNGIEWNKDKSIGAKERI